MKIYCKKNLSVLIIIFSITLILSSDSIIAQSAIKPYTYSADSAKYYRKQYKKKEAWEYVLMAPGELVYLPMRATLKITKFGVIYVNDSQIIPRAIGFLTSDDGRRGVLPVYAARTGAGMKLFQKGWINEGSKLNLEGTVGLRSRQRYMFSLRNIKLFNNKLSTDIIVRYQFLSDEKFYGFGPDSDPDDESNYAFEQTTAYFSLGSSKENRFSFELFTGIDNTNIFNGKAATSPSSKRLYDFRTLPGLETGVTIGRIQLNLRYESRNSFRNTAGGGVLQASMGLFRESGGDRFGFWRSSVDYRRYFNLFYNRILVLRLAGEVTEELSGRLIPFQYMPELGEKTTIRGFQRGRFRDKDMVLVSAEYRYPVWQTTLDGMVFFDAGQVSPDIFNEYDSKNFKTGYGFGFNYWGKEGIALQIILSRSTEGFRFYFLLNQEF